MSTTDSKVNKDLKQLVDIFKALGDPTRLKILMLLTSSKKLCVGSIANTIGISQPAISQQLKILKHTGLIDAQKIGLYVHYCVNEEMMNKFGKSFTGLFLKAPKNICVKCPDKR
jgi:DNA-binding transcriptional ArsR family regulator